MNKLVIDKVSKTFGNFEALREISFQVEQGEFFTLLGPSGCGKTTMLSCIAGLERPNSGAIRVGESVFFDGARGQFMLPEERNLGMVFQSYALWPHMSVAENIALPLRLRKVGRKTQAEQIDAVLEQVGLLEYRDRYPHELSGGQQQRVALARALVYSPSILLLDEPLSNLDAKLRDSARSWLKTLQRDVGITTIYVTHDQAEALSLSDRIAVMHTGRMLQVDTPKRIYEQPVSEVVADFVGHCNFLSAQVAEVGGSMSVLKIDDQIHLRVSTDRPAKAHEQVRLGFRAERVGIYPGSGDGTHTDTAVNRLTGQLVETGYVGSHYEYRVKVSGHQLLVESSKEVPQGEVTLTIPPDQIYVLREP